MLYTYRTIILEGSVEMEPIFLAEIDVGRVNCLRFLMPEQEIGRNDIEITIEYGDAPDTSNDWVCNVWARIGDSILKGFIASLHVQKSEDDIDAIMRALNEQDDFLSALESYIEFMPQE